MILLPIGQRFTDDLDRDLGKGVWPADDDLLRVGLRGIVWWGNEWEAEYKFPPSVVSATDTTAPTFMPDYDAAPAAAATRLLSLWHRLLQLEGPDTNVAAGPPRAVRGRGRLFAFGYRDNREARWPHNDKNLPPSTTELSTKYRDGELPKTSLYEATRRLLVSQMGQDNGDVFAERLSLTAMGAEAHLRYAAAVAPTGDRPSNRDGANSYVPKYGSRDAAADEEGMLSEWKQKSQLGRDIYVRETFTGFWMPFGFKGEIVTVTERLPSTTHPAQAQAGQEAVDVFTQEASLTAFLVARKFGRVLPRKPNASDPGELVQTAFKDEAKQV